VPTTPIPYQREFRHFRRKIMKLRPLHDHVVVKRLEEELKTKGGIIIPDTAAEKARTASSSPWE
jgi:Chaperonin 10 Kd subunit